MQITEKKVTRDSNVELLRIFCIIGVIVLHYVSPGAGGGLKYADGINNQILGIFESLFICAVDVFVLITGYFMSKSKKRNIIKPVQLIIQVVLFSEANYILHCLIGNDQLGLKSFIANLIPCNYFVIFYITLYFISPFINIIIDKLSDKGLKQFVILLIVLFSLWPTAVDTLQMITNKEWLGLGTIGIYGSQQGYTIVNFVLMYIIGAYIGKLQIQKISFGKYVALYIITIVLLVFWRQIDSATAMAYFNPLVIAESVIVFLLFSKIKFRSKIINGLAKGVFSVFLLHSIFLPRIKIEYFVKSNMFIMIAHVAISSLLIYLVCWCAYFVYEKTTSIIYKKIISKFPILTKQIFDIDSI